METQDETLVSRILAGDANALGELLGLHYDMMFSLGFQLLGSKAEAEDLTQDICLALPAKLKGFRGKAKLKTWLYRVTINAAKDRRRELIRQQKLGEDWRVVETLSQIQNNVEREELEWLSQAMTKLSNDQRETLALILGQDMTHAEAAEVLGISEGTVSWRISEARKALKTLAQQEEQI